MCAFMPHKSMKHSRQQVLQDICFIISLLGINKCIRVRIMRKLTEYFLRGRHRHFQRRSHRNSYSVHIRFILGFFAKLNA